MPFQGSELKVALAVAHAAFWLLVLLRVVASMRGAGAERAARAADEERVAEGSRQGSGVALRAATAGFVAYYVLLFAWALGDGLPGPDLLPRSTAVQVVGLVAVAAGLALLAWAYMVFSSFRVRAQIDAGHVLVEEGPYGRMRHPIYTALIVFYAGATLLLPELLVVAAGLLLIVAHVGRALAEEAVLLDAFGDEYRDYLRRTPRFAPGL